MHARSLFAATQCLSCSHSHCLTLSLFGLALSLKVNCVEIYWFFQSIFVFFKHFGTHNLILFKLLLVSVLTFQSIGLSLTGQSQYDQHANTRS